MTHMLEASWFLQNSDIKTAIVSENDSLYHHHDFYEIVYSIDGDIPYIFNNEMKILKVGEIIFLKLDDCHGYSREKDNNFNHRDIMIKEHFFKDICGYVGTDIYKKMLSLSDEFKIKFDILEQNRIEEQIKRVERLSAMNSPNTDVFTKLLGVELIGIFVKSLFLQENTISSLVSEVMDKLSDSKNFNRTIGEIMTEFHYDNAYICRTFKNNIKMTLTEFFNKQKIDYAISLLLSTQLTITEISSLCGYNSISRFNHEFKNQMNISPRDYRKRLKTFN